MFARARYSMTEPAVIHSASALPCAVHDQNQYQDAKTIER